MPRAGGGPCFRAFRRECCNQEENPCGRWNLDPACPPNCRCSWRWRSVTVSSRSPEWHALTARLSLRTLQALRPRQGSLFLYRAQANPARGEEVVNAVAWLGRQMAARLAGTEPDTTVRALPAVTTTSLPALKAYALARRAHAPRRPGGGALARRRGAHPRHPLRSPTSWLATCSGSSTSRSTPRHTWHAPTRGALGFPSANGSSYEPGTSRSSGTGPTAPSPCGRRSSPAFRTRFWVTRGWPGRYERSNGSAGQRRWRTRP